MPTREYPDYLANFGIADAGVHPNARVHGHHFRSETDLVDTPLALNRISRGYDNIGFPDEAELLVLRQLQEVGVEARGVTGRKVSPNTIG